MRSDKERLIFPLDVSSVETAKRYVILLGDEVGLFKVGLELFVHAGPELVRFVSDTGSAKLFLDLKLHDIPATVGRAMARIANLGVAFATVHCGENPDMLRAAVDGSGGKVGVLGVTVLTSVSKDHLRSAGYREEFCDDLSSLVVRRAADARAAGCAGVVCSGQEAGRIKEAVGSDFLTVTPGIRPAWEGIGKDDQQRVTTPEQAIRNGSDYLVVGRPIRDAQDPKAAARQVVAEIRAAREGLTGRS